MLHITSAQEEMNEEEKHYFYDRMFDTELDETVRAIEKENKNKAPKILNDQGMIANEKFEIIYIFCDRFVWTN